MINLKYKYPMMHGSAVRRLQELLNIVIDDNIAEDGIFGIETKTAVRNFQKQNGLKKDGIYGPITRRILFEKIQYINPYKYDPKGDIISIVDLHTPPKLYAKQRRKKTITGITLHQTGCRMSKNPMHWLRCNAHFGITQGGKAIYLNDIKDFIWHAQGLSRTTIGIEIEGNYPGIMGDESTLWEGGGGPHMLNAYMYTALTNIYIYILDLLKQRPLTVYAHRQSYKSRIADPGDEIWRAEKSIRVSFGLLESIKRDENWFCGSGRAIPKAWSETATAKYY